MSRYFLLEKIRTWLSIFQFWFWCVTYSVSIFFSWRRKIDKRSKTAARWGLHWKISRFIHFFHFSNQNPFLKGIFPYSNSNRYAFEINRWSRKQRKIFFFKQWLRKWEWEWIIGGKREECVRCCRPWIRSCHSKSPSRKSTASLTRDYVPVFRRKIEKLSWRCMTNIESGALSFNCHRNSAIGFNIIINFKAEFLTDPKILGPRKITQDFSGKKQKIIVQSVTLIQCNLEKMKDLR